VKKDSPREGFRHGPSQKLERALPIASIDCDHRRFAGRFFCGTRTGRTNPAPKRLAVTGDACTSISGVTNNPYRTAVLMRGSGDACENQFDPPEPPSS
jgi:hypothetical protein